jgi:hypothetical protein
MEYAQTPLEQTLRQTYEGQMLEFDVEDVEAYKEPPVQPQPEPAPTKPESQPPSRITGPDYRAWEDTLMKPEDVQEAAARELVRRETYGDDETIPCVAAHGGRPVFDCTYCAGCGHAAKYPRIILRNEVTGEERQLKLDLAQLVANGEVAVELQARESIDPHSQSVEKKLNFNVGDYIERNIVEMGIDPRTTMRDMGDQVQTLETGRDNIMGRRDYWRRRGGIVSSGCNSGDKDMSADTTLARAQYALTRGHAWPFGRKRDERGIVSSEVWSMGPARSLEATLKDLVTGLDRYGYRLGYSLGGIATCEVAPAFYALDQRGSVLDQLSNNYHVGEAMENAWRTFQTMGEEELRTLGDEDDYDEV